LRDKANRAIRLPEIIDSAISLRCEIQDWRDWRALLWRKVVNIIGGGGDEDASSVRVGAAKEARRAHVVDEGECVDALVGGLYTNILLNNLAKQDESLTPDGAAHCVEWNR
jgi:hypothetical protein